MKSGRRTRIGGGVVVCLVLALAAQTAQAAVLHDNGGLNPQPTSKSGVAAPAGTQWSEVQNDTGDTATANTNGGSSAHPSQFRLADDFTVPAGQSWSITSVDTFGYQTGAPLTPSPFTAATLRIWSGEPGVGGSTIVFGDTTTNRLGSSTDTSLLRIFNTVVPPATAPGSTRRIWNNVLTVAPTLVLGPGTYWVDWNTTVANNPASANFAPAVTVEGSRTLAGWNARQSTNLGVAWSPLLDLGQPSTAPDVAQDFPFKVNGTATITPAAPTITTTTPASPSNNNDPLVKGTLGAGPSDSVKVYKTANCTGPATTGTAAAFTGAGIAVSVAANATTPLSATASNIAGESACSNTINYIEDSTAPDTTIDSGPTGSSATPTFGFSSSQSPATFECALDAGAFAACSGPGNTHTTPVLTTGAHTFKVRATDAAGNPDPTAAERAFTVTASGGGADTVAPETTISKGPKKKSKKKKATFEFASSEAGSTFACSLNGAAPSPCTSPLKVKGKKGKNTFTVTATDAAKNADATPATYSWKVKKKKK